LGASGPFRHRGNHVGSVQTYPTDSYFKRHWRGELSLPRSYWLNGVLIFGIGINLVFMVVFYAAIYASEGNTAVVIVVCLLDMVLDLAGYIWALVGTWRAAGRYQGPKFWSILARIAMVIGVLISIAHVSQDLHIIGVVASR
jgi:hypothetical protein